MQKQKSNTINTVLLLSSLDPQGSAGISSDILSINNSGSFALPLITNITVQNTAEVFAITPISSKVLIQQFNAINDDTIINIVKIGLITKQNLVALTYIFSQIKVKIVLDPIIKSSTKNDFNNIDTIKNILKNIFLLTPNVNELELLTDEKNQEQAVKKLNIPWTLITQTDNSNIIITHKLFKKNKLVKEFKYRKLAGNYHGSGCVLSASIAGKINSMSVIQACEYGLNYTYQTLTKALKIGKMQFSPNHISYNKL